MNPEGEVRDNNILWTVSEPALNHETAILKL
jgi:hypothetical protein